MSRGYSTEVVRGVIDGTRLIAVDVGAALGLPDTWQALRRSAYFYLIEPDEEACEKLPGYFSPEESDSYRVLPVALSQAGGVQKFYRANAPTGSSLLPPLTRMARDYCKPSYFYPMQMLEIVTRSLRDVFDEIGEDQLDLFKLDTQGTELDLLRGLGAERMNRVLGVELEIGIPGAYRDQAQLADVQVFMSEHGLELLDWRVARAHRLGADVEDYAHYHREVFGVSADAPSIARRIWEIDALFCRNPEELLESRDTAALQRLIAIYCTYRFFVEAYHLVEMGLSRGAFDIARTRQLRSLIVAWHAEVKSAIEGGMQVSWMRYG